MVHFELGKNRLTEPHTLKAFELAQDAIEVAFEARFVSAVGGSQLLQFRVLGLGLLQDGDVGVGVLPQGQKILIRGASLGSVSLQYVRAPELQMSQRPNGFVEHNSAMVEDFLKLCCCFFALVGRKVALSSHIHRIQIRPVVKPRSRQTKFIWSSDLQSIQRLTRPPTAAALNRVWATIQESPSW